MRSVKSSPAALSIARYNKNNMDSEHLTVTIDGTQVELS